ncbi:hypothetical protein A9995_15060 [Erythrobacter sp. QSSC1-22B]|uniref:winged helix-turn-helix transcriptional regulator n=1 Tax=Erythrobacter sp. QSSC1-22B TaxID=1860125 RepID=UPI000804C831|nr:helix-turn-helix domain-containing protein [Erythrobacter sp. QSSC1-22B]OBX17703.1 hypothetical protein A9995_15060 [Erythrobacter sp. QSSC1-22B]
MPRKKPYDDGCATAHALDLFGERWALLIIRELIPGPQRFSDLKAALPGISSNILTVRLGELERSYIAVRRQLPPPAPAMVYELTEWGAELEPIIKSIGKWAAKSPTMAQGMPMSAASVMLSFRTMFDADRAAGLDLNFDLILDRRAHSVSVSNGELTIEPNQLANAKTTVAGNPDLVAGVVYGGLSLDDAQQAGLAIQGDPAMFEAFARLFPLPAKAEGSKGSNARH